MNMNIILADYSAFSDYLYLKVLCPDTVILFKRHYFDSDAVLFLCL